MSMWRVGVGGRVVLLCCAWYSLSWGSNVAGKVALTRLGRPLTVSMAQLGGGAALGAALLTLTGVRAGAPERRHLLTLAAAKFLTTLCSQLSLWKVPVSYAHTVKATTPLWTALLARILLGERQSARVAASLTLIALGVVAASLTELQFDAGGLTAALMAAALLSAQHIYTKRVMSDTSVHPLRLLQSVSQAAALLFTPLWLLADGTWLMSAPLDWQTSGLLALVAGLSWLQAAAAFSVLSLVSPLSYAVASSAKRCVVVVGSLLWLRNPAPPANLAGMALTLAGVAAYNTAKIKPKASPLLPTYTTYKA